MQLGPSARPLDLADDVGPNPKGFPGEFVVGGALLDAVLPGSDLSYRARLEPWVGTPTYPPAGAARRQDGGAAGRGGRTTVYASWNGDTEVVSWRVLSGPSASALSAVASASRSGFETAIPLGRSYATYEVQALDSRGRAIGTSPPFSAGR